MFFESIKIKSDQNGFSLIELMIAVAIIGVLVAMAIPNYNHMLRRTRYRMATFELIGFAKAADATKTVENKALLDITGTGCTRCSFAGAGDDMFGVIPDATSQANNKLSIGHENPIDPWNAPYMLDENETELADCRLDMIASAGYNGIYEQSAAGSDDIWILVKPFRNLTCIGSEPTVLKVLGLHIGPGGTY